MGFLGRDALDTRLRWIALLGSCLLSGGCVTTEISGSGSSVSLRGFLSDTSVVSMDGPMAIRVKGFGAHRSASTLQVGWFAETTIMVPRGSDDCRIFLIDASPEETKALAGLLRDAGVAGDMVCGPLGQGDTDNEVDNFRIVGHGAVGGLRTP
jgi:hypothetical protein